MKHTLISLGILLAAALLIFSGLLPAQQTISGNPPVVQPTVQQYPCNQQQTATSAGNGAAAVTFAAQSGSAFYICSIYISEIANAAVTGAAGPAPLFTTAGLQNNLVWWGDNSSLTIGQLKVITDVVYPLGQVKSLPNTAFSITNSGGQSTQNVRINVTGFYGPA